MPTCPLYMAVQANKRTQTKTDLIFILIRGSSLRAGGQKKAKNPLWIFNQANYLWTFFFLLLLCRVLLLFCNRSLPKKQLSHNFNIFTYKATVKLADSNHYHRAAKLLCVPWPRWSMKLMRVRNKKTAQRMFEKRYALKSRVLWGR